MLGLIYYLGSHLKALAGSGSHDIGQLFLMLVHVCITLHAGHDLKYQIRFLLATGYSERYRERNGWQE